MERMLRNAVLQYQLPIFENLCPSWEQVTFLGRRCTFVRGQQILDLHARVEGVYFVQEGSVEILLYTSRGPEKALFYVGAGCIFGEVSCFVSGEDSDEASVRARSDCVAYFFSRELIEGVIAERYPHLLIELIRASACKIRMYGVLLRDTLNNDHFVRVCKMIVYLVHYKGAPVAAGQRQVSLRPGITQNDLARLMGVHRVTVTKAIGRLKAMGVIHRFSKNVLEIVDFVRLSELAVDD